MTDKELIKWAKENGFPLRKGSFNKGAVLVADLSIIKEQPKPLL